MNMMASDKIVSMHSYGVSVDAVEGIVTVSIEGYDGITDLSVDEARRLASIILDAADFAERTA